MVSSHEMEHMTFKSVILSCYHYVNPAGIINILHSLHQECKSIFFPSVNFISLILMFIYLLSEYEQYKSLPLIQTVVIKTPADEW